MKRLKPKYVSWVFNLLADLALSILGILLIYWGWNWEDQVLIDLNGPLLIVAGVLFLCWDFYEIFVLFQFYKVESGRVITTDWSTLIVETKQKTEQLKISELQKVIFSKGRYLSRTPTAHLSYSELLFKGNRKLTITSFLLNSQSLEKQLGNTSYIKVWRHRTLFEGIRNNIALSA